MKKYLVVILGMIGAFLLLHGVLAIFWVSPLVQGLTQGLSITALGLASFSVAVMLMTNGED